MLNVKYSNSHSSCGTVAVTCYPLPKRSLGIPHQYEKRYNRAILVAIAASICVSPRAIATNTTTIHAQLPNPNEDRFLQPVPEPLPPEPAPVLPPPEPTPPPEQLQPIEIPLRQIEVVGNTVLKPEQLDQILQPLQGRTVTVTELIAATNAITQLYQQQGYLTSRAVLLPQQIKNGTVQILAIEGNIEDIQIEGNNRIDSSYIRQRIQLEQSPLQVSELEDRLRLLRIDPLFDNLEASLQAGSDLGQSILIVKVTEANAFFGSTSFDNYSPPSVGSQRLGIDLGIRDVSGFGDYFTVSYDRSTTGGLDLWDLNYSLPVNAQNGTLGLRTLIGYTEVTEDEFEQFDIEGESELYEISFRQPLIRTPRQEFAISLGFSFRDGQTFIFDNVPQDFGLSSDESGVGRTSVFRFGQDYLKRDLQGAWSMRSQFSLGTGLFDATTNADPIPDSRFISWQGQVQRFQRLSDRQLLIITADLQLTPDSLLSSEQFIIGGGQSVRGYTQNVRSGDNGFRFSIEDRIAVVRDSQKIPILQLAPFFDAGNVWNSDNPNQLSDRNFLSSIGLGLLWQPLPKLDLRLDYALSLVDLDENSDSLQDDGFNFSLGYGF